MKLGRAIAVVKSINSPDPAADVPEKLEAIKTITQAATLNSVTKQDLLRIIRWMIEQGEDHFCGSTKMMDHFPDATKMVPLTLEQLRGMANKPYWHVGLRKDSGAPNWRILDPLLAYHPEDYDYGVAWLAYAYSPAHIDREAWTAKWTVDEFGHKCSKCGEYLPSGDDDITPQFCPSCGRATTSDALAELEKRLRGVNLEHRNSRFYWVHHRVSHGMEGASVDKKESKWVMA